MFLFVEIKLLLKICALIENLWLSPVLLWDFGNYKSIFVLLDYGSYPKEKDYLSIP